MLNAFRNPKIMHYCYETKGLSCWWLVQSTVLYLVRVSSAGRYSVTCMTVTVDGVSIGHWFYWTLQLTSAPSLIHTLCSSLQHILSLLSLLCLHQSLSGDDGSQPCPLLACSRCYRLANVPQLTHCSSCPAYKVPARIAQKTSFLCYCSVVS
jgi:hypothetical protein